MQNKKQVLLISTLLMLPYTYGLFQLTTILFGAKWGYMTGFFGYWAYCLLIAWWVSGSNLIYFKKLWHPKNCNAVNWVSLAAFVPVIAIFFISFLPNATKLSLSAIGLLIIMLVFNGFIEELYWRGLYLLEYPENARIGFLYSWLFFGAWHLSLWFAKGILYKDGLVYLIGGAYGLGLLWTWVVRSNKNLRAVIPAHILVNLFAFTAFFVDNGF